MERYTRPSEAAVALGIANQLTNILRDIGEDRQRGRIYLPQEDIEHFNYSEEELLKGVNNKQWKRLMNFQLKGRENGFANPKMALNGYLLMQDGQYGLLYAI